MAAGDGDESPRPDDWVPPPPDGLYGPHELFGGWDPDDPSSAARTFDFAVWETTHRQGPRVPPTRDVARDRAVHDAAISWALHNRLTDEDPVAIMGGHSLARNDPSYRLAAEVAHDLAAAGHLVLSGGGPGAMEATHLGARTATASLGLDDALGLIGADRPVGDDDGRLRFPFSEAGELLGPEGVARPEAVERLHRWQSPAFAAADALGDATGATIGIPTWLYGHEPPTPLATAHAKYLDNSIREDGLLAVATGGIVFAPGRAGTLQEVFQDAAQNYYRSVAGRFSPMVFLDLDGFWTEEFAVKNVLDRLFRDTEGARVRYVTSAAAAVEAIDELNGRFGNKL